MYPKILNYNALQVTSIAVRVDYVYRKKIKAGRPCTTNILK